MIHIKDSLLPKGSKLGQMCFSWGKSTSLSQRNGGTWTPAVEPWNRNPWRDVTMDSPGGLGGENGSCGKPVISWVF